MNLDEYLMNLDRQLEKEQKELNRHIGSFWQSYQVFHSIKHYENKIL